MLTRTKIKQKYEALRESREIFSEVKKYIDSKSGNVAEVNYEWGSEKYKTLVGKQGDTYYAMEPDNEKEEQDSLLNPPNDGSKSTKRSGKKLEDILNPNAGFADWSPSDPALLESKFGNFVKGAALAGALSLGAVNANAKAPVDAHEGGGKAKTELSQASGPVTVKGMNNVTDTGAKQIIELLQSKAPAGATVSVGTGVSDKSDMANRIADANASAYKTGGYSVSGSRAWNAMYYDNGTGKYKVYSVYVFDKDGNNISRDFYDLAKDADKEHKDLKSKVDAQKASETSNSDDTIDAGEELSKAGKAVGGFFKNIGQNIANSVKDKTGKLRPLAPPN